MRNKNGNEEEWPGLIAEFKETIALGMTPEDWKKVWSVCGGNVYLLKKCVDYARYYKSWEKGKKTASGVLFGTCLLVSNICSLFVIACLQA